uniref:Large ribosomal subunit protein bL35c n=1 Tax=Pterocladiophila hemisphaerica TaxID=2712948 RepID=A0A6M3WWI3_9FLOR|nr:ribosomal protein L35 [Pterocladiophila hemisphaerica]
MKFKKKNNQSIVKRFKLTAQNKIIRCSAFRKHFLRKKTGRFKQKLKNNSQVMSSDYKLIYQNLF